MHADHQVEILANGAGAKSANASHQIGSKYAESTGNDRQHLEQRPSFTADEERAKIFNHLQDFDRRSGQANVSDACVLHRTSIQDANDAADGNHGTSRSGTKARHNTKKGVLLE